MDTERFEELVRQAVDSLPQEIADRMSNIGIEVQTAPTRRQIAAGRVPPGATLLGLYVGVPLTKRGAWYNMTLPDRVIIFQQPIEYFSRTDEAIVDKVREVVIHEIGHHFGLSDERLREIENERHKRTA